MEVTIPMDSTVERFVELFRGGRIAIDNYDDSKGFRPWESDTGEPKEATGETFYQAVLTHFGSY